jgi:hypothetical protein
MPIDRPLLTEDLDRCHFHPEAGSVGWRDLRDEGGALVATVGVCQECSDAMPVPLMPVET